MMAPTSLAMFSLLVVESMRWLIVVVGKTGLL